MPGFHNLTHKSLWLQNIKIALYSSLIYKSSQSWLSHKMCGIFRHSFTVFRKLKLKVEVYGDCLQSYKKTGLPESFDTLLVSLFKKKIDSAPIETV